MITSDAITVIITIIRIELGTWLRIIDTQKFETAVTRVTAKAITITDSIFVVTARAEQIPRICKAIGLFSNSGPKRVFLTLIPSLLIVPWKLNHQIQLAHEICSRIYGSHHHQTSSSPSAQHQPKLESHQRDHQLDVQNLVVL